MAPLFYALRLLSLLLFAAVVLAALYFVPQPDPWVLTLAGLAGFAVALAYLRHAGLALAAELFPASVISEIRPIAAPMAMRWCRRSAGRSGGAGTTTFSPAVSARR